MYCSFDVYQGEGGKQIVTSVYMRVYDRARQAMGGGGGGEAADSTRATPGLWEGKRKEEEEGGEGGRGRRRGGERKDAKRVGGVEMSAEASWGGEREMK